VIGETTVPEVRRTTSGIRTILLIGAGLVALAGIQLFILTDHTDQSFAWTIKVPLTAAFLGAFYFTALVLATLSAREQVWANARVAVPGVLLFITLTFVATLLHVSLFHFGSDDSVARGSAWLWLAIYAIDPPAVLILWLLQLREAGIDPPRTGTLPPWYRALVAFQAVVTLSIGAAFFLLPDRSLSIWPWPLTPLTARAVAAWLLGLGVVLVTALRENEWRRIRPASSAYVTLGVLQFVALARYPDTVDWGRAAAWLYAAFLVTVLLAGVAGWILSSREERTAVAVS
jgi:hypothetical protein